MSTDGEAANGFDPDHHFYDQLGNPITLQQWGALRSENCTLAEDRFGDDLLRTVYLGFVDPSVFDARLFGTALINYSHTDWRRIQQIQVYDSEQDALIGHMRHVEARNAGLHCYLCRIGQQHQD